MEINRTAWNFLMVIVMIGGLMLSGCGRMRHHCGHCGSPDKSMNWMVKKVTRDLNLTMDQQLAVERIKADLLKESGTLKAIRTGTYDELLMQFEATVFDQMKVNTVLDSNEARLKEFRSLAVVKLAEFHSILTPDQRMILVKKMKKHKMNCDSRRCSK